jgi:hypothetical protein
MVLDLVKNSLGIPLDSHELDAELNALIEASKELLRGSGVNEKYLVDEADPLVTSFILIYVSTSFGFKSDGNLKELPKHFDFLLKQLALTKHD